jgi:uncharacterized protein (DUF2461 family)
MTFEEWWPTGRAGDWYSEKDLAQEVWQAAQQAERNRINALVIKVRAQGNFAGTAWWDAAEEIRRIIHAPT